MLSPAIHRVLVIGLVLLGLVASAEAKEDRRDINGLSFVLPAGWKLAQAAGADHASLTHAGKTRYCIVSLYQARAAGPDVDAEFATEWKAIAGTLKDEAFTTTRRTVGGRGVLEASAPTTVDGTALIQRVAVVDGGGQIATFVIFTPDAAATAAYKKDIDGIMASLKFPAAAPGPAPVPAPVPADSAPVKGISGTPKSTITIADLAGTWSFGAGSTTSYVDRSTGAYSGTSTVFYAESYAIKANGAFDYKFTGRSTATVRESDSGTITLEGDLVIFKFKGTRGTKRYQFIGFVTQPDGTAVLSIHGADKERMSADWLANNCGPVKGVMHCVGGEEWARFPVKRK